MIPAIGRPQNRTIEKIRDAHATLSLQNDIKNGKTKNNHRLKRPEWMDLQKGQVFREWIAWLLTIFPNAVKIKKIPTVV